MITTTTDFATQRDSIFSDLLFDLAVGGSRFYAQGMCIMHHVNALITPGNRVSRTTLERAADVAARWSDHAVTIARVDDTTYEVWVVQ